MFIDAEKFHYQNDLTFFLCLKLVYPDGKVMLNEDDLTFLEFICQISSRKTTLKYINLFLELNFLRYNEKTGFYLLNSFESIRQFHDWNVRSAFPVSLSNFDKVKAITGAIIYGYLHMDFWRKLKREKSVQFRGCTYHFPLDTKKIINSYAPVSVLGVNKIFGISIASASRLKKAAKEEGFIKVKKNFEKSFTENKTELLLYNKYADFKTNMFYRDGEYVLQSIDTICPQFHFQKRSKLKTYNRGF
jgi:hypothetical protein